MATTIDENDPCAAVTTLRAVYLKLIAGESAISVSFTSGPGGVSRSSTFQPGNPERLQAMIREFEQKCALKQGKRPSRFAMRGGGI